METEIISFEFENSYLNLAHTLECGQCFRWKKLEDGFYYGVAGAYFIRVRQVQKYFQVEMAGDNPDPAAGRAFFNYYFGLDSDTEYQQVLQKINTDPAIRQTLEKYAGLRLLRQQPFEIIISFILATNNNIPATSRTIQALSKRYGQALRLGRYQGYTFPAPQQLALSNDYEINHVFGAEYRGKYVIETTKLIVEQNFDFERLRELPYDWAHGQLTAFPGVGRSVADWVLLFALEKREAFPLDTWVTKAMETFYFKGQKATPKEILTLAATKWQEEAGYANEFLYMYARNNLKNYETKR